MTTPNNPCCRSEDVGKLLIRLTVGGLMLFHGVTKITGGIGGIGAMLSAKGLPEAMAYGVYVGEVLAPLLLIVGLFTRLSAAVFAFNMVVAVLLVHAGDLLKLSDHGGWAIELPAFFCLSAVAIVLLGPGGLSLDAMRKAPPASSASEG